MLLVIFTPKTIATVLYFLTQSPLKFCKSLTKSLQQFRSFSTLWSDFLKISLFFTLIMYSGVDPIFSNIVESAQFCRKCSISPKVPNFAESAQFRRKCPISPIVPNFDDFYFEKNFRRYWATPCNKLFVSDLSPLNFPEGIRNWA